MQFPWSAVVGQESLKHALILCAIDPAIGGVLVHGPRGVAKTTLARALAELVTGQFVELPLGATEERVTGTLNLELALQDGRVEFAPGLLARSHDGVLYVDEVNLLPDALVDLLLDAAATGRNVVERDGVSHTHPAKFVLIGSMNPEEGELRPQLIDRFGLSASAEGLIPPVDRAEIVMRRLEFDRDPEGFRARFAAQQVALIERCKRARERAIQIPMAGPALSRVTERCHAAGVEGVRADLAMLRAARANAAWNDRVEITAEDVDAVAELALAHRAPRDSRGGPGSGGGRGGAAEGGGRGSSGGGGQSGGARLSSGARDAMPMRDPRASTKQLGQAEGSPGGTRSLGGNRMKAAGEEREWSGEDATGADEDVDGESGSSGDDDFSFAAGDANRGSGGARDRGASRARPVRAVAVPELPRWMIDARGMRAGKQRRGAARLAAASGARGRASEARGAIDWFATLSQSMRERGSNACVDASSRRESDLSADRCAGLQRGSVAISDVQALDSRSRGDANSRRGGDVGASLERESAAINDVPALESVSRGDANSRRGGDVGASLERESAATKDVPALESRTHDDASSRRAGDVSAEGRAGLQRESAAIRGVPVLASPSHDDANATREINLRSDANALRESSSRRASESRGDSGSRDGSSGRRELSGNEVRARDDSRRSLPRTRLLRAHLRYRARRTPASQLWIVAVDCSASMLRSGGLAVAKGVAHAIEIGAQRAGARLAVISFRGAEAQLEVDSSPGRAVLPRAIAALGGGGGTPLHEALVAARALCNQTRWRAPGVFKRFLLLTDGRVREAPASVATLPANLERVVIDCEQGRVRLGRAQQLAAALRGAYWHAGT